MKILLIVVALVLLHVSEQSVSSKDGLQGPPKHNKTPCEKNKDNNAYNRFVRKHILKKKFDRTSKPEWKKYLKKTGLCDRPLQSFFEKEKKKEVVRICNGFGRPLAKPNAGNLCISDSTIPQYKVSVDTRSCNIKEVEPLQILVIVACDKVENSCLPVHFEKYNNQKINKKAKRCSPSV